MLPASKKRRAALASSEERLKTLSSTPKKKKKVEDESSVKKTHRKGSQKKEPQLPSLPSTSVNGSTANTSDKSVNAKKENKRKGKLEREEMKKPSEPVNIDSLNVEQLLALGESSNTFDFKKERTPPDFEDTSDSEMSDFEEVKDTNLNEPIIPKEGVNITLEIPNLYHKNKKKSLDVEAHLKRQLNKVKRDIQLLMHKVHLLCWIAHMKFVNDTLNTPSLMKDCVTLVKSMNVYPPKYADLTYLERIVKWFFKNVELRNGFEDPKCKGGLFKELSYQFSVRKAFSFRDFIFMFIIFLRVVGLKARIVMSFQVLPVKPSASELYDSVSAQSVKSENSKKDNVEESNKVSSGDLKIKKEPGSKDLPNEEVIVRHSSQKKADLKKKAIAAFKSSEAQKAGKGKKIKSATSKTIKEEDVEDDSDDEFLSKHFSPTMGKGKARVKSKQNKETGSQSKNSCKTESNKKSEEVGKGGKSKNNSKTDKSTNNNSDDDFTPSSLKNKGSAKKTDRRTKMDEESPASKKKGVDVWTEVYLEAEEKWISVDVPRQKIHCIGELYARATHPVVYVVACNNEFTLKDVTKRYVPNWHSDTRKKRVDEEWWNDTMKPYLPPSTALDREEDEDINRQISDKPLPAVISEYKDHPLYALKRHLLKFEGIYPPDAPTLGFVRGEPVYARECVVTLRSREMWYKEARVVRLSEEPYKIVKARPKFDKMSGEIKKDLPLELYGIWQTEEYIPPIAVDGKVPRNEYGNVDLFKPCMLPKGTVHLQIPALNRVAKKLGIDCAPATVGFEFHSGGSHPIFDGFVVCEEFKEVLLDTWNKEIDESAKRSEEKKEKRVYGNWKRLIRGLLIREKLKIKYAFGGNSDEEDCSTSSTANTSTSKK